MAFSSFRKIKKASHRDHKERAQPEKRRKLGILEKKNDYKFRAKSWQKKSTELKKLLIKAEEKNPDEFYYAMKNSKMKDGIHEDLPAASDLTEAKIQQSLQADARYLQYKMNCERSKVERLQGSVQLGAGGHHTFFVDSKRELRRFDLSKRLDTLPQLVEHRCNRRTLAQLEGEPAVARGPQEDAELVATARARKRTLTELVQRRERLEALEAEWRTRQEKLKLVENRKYKHMANVWRRKR